MFLESEVSMLAVGLAPPAVLAEPSSKVTAPVVVLKVPPLSERSMFVVPGAITPPLIVVTR